jgi:hypothetical protein
MRRYVCIRNTTETRYIQPIGRGRSSVGRHQETLTECARASSCHDQRMAIPSVGSPKAHLSRKHSCRVAVRHHARARQVQSRARTYVPVCSSSNSPVTSSFQFLDSEYKQSSRYKSHAAIGAGTRTCAGPVRPWH